MAKQATLNKYFLKPSRSNGNDDDESEIQSEVTETADAVAPAKKKQKCRAFRPEWKSEFPWLRCDIIDGEENMFCSHCEKSGRKNGFTRGATNMRISALTEQSVQ
ncbi:hypothetical protein AAFF_G00336110 [Aldrovandia affinis]|uniref:C17orf113 probable zinc finger domain-containing protein n=1 Tax=Aldrovandia affinis TaxID=143900 RepID=A0AAD7SM53_9TELE|nr:hypothetical protein AAFF_G00336110 [Aldrovandia affinis]